MEPLYFCKESRRLFGVYHPPIANPPHEIGVILCYPIGWEYLSAHHAYVRLASMIASSGIPTLRFDYFGCGDSEGDSTEGTASQWIDDISAAIRELEAGTGITRLFLIGCQFGATLSLMAGALQEDVSGVVLWEPVVNGRAYIRHLHRQQEDWQRSYMSPSCRQEQLSEVLGFPLVETLMQEIMNIDLTTFREPLLRNALILESRKTIAARRLTGVLRAGGTQVSYKRIPEMRESIRQDGTRSFMNPQVFQCILDWLLKVGS